MNLKSYNTFGIDVNCRELIAFDDAKVLDKVFETISGKWYVLGGGSNTLFTKDFDGVIIHPQNIGIEVVEENDDNVLICAQAGVEWDDFVSYCVANNYYGAENLSLIPGSVGASPVQNIGAYGCEAKDIIARVEYYDTVDRCVKNIEAKDCEFGYRDSIFKNSLAGMVVVVSVTFRLSKYFKANVKYGNITNELDPNRELTASLLRDTIIRIREAKLPNPKLIGNGGSFFKNPIVTRQKFEELQKSYPKMPYYDDPKGVKIPAGWLIDTVGWKGKRDGLVGVHSEQALVLVNYGGGTGGDVMALAGKIICDVESRFGINLSPEINVL